MPTELVIGPPGTGKTTDLSRMVREAVQAGETPLVCSLTRTAAQEVAGRDLPIPRDQVGTLHSHALRALGRPEVYLGHLGDWNSAQPGLALSRGIVDPDEPTERQESGMPGDDHAESYHLLRARCVDREAWPATTRYFAERWEAWKRDTECVDFSDMIEQAAEVYPESEPTVLFVDEAQDHSQLELELLRAWATRAGRLVLVGDPWQALYEWRGAHPEMFQRETAGGRRVLSNSFRVPRRVHSMAIRWVRQLSTYEPIEYEPRMAVGSVGLLGATWREPVRVLDLAAEHVGQGETVMIAASCGYMLVPTITALKEAGVPYSNPWRTKRGDWNPLTGGSGVSMAQRLLALLSPFGVDEDDSFNFGCNANCPAWSTQDFARWAVVLKAKGVIKRGQKKVIEEMLKVRDSAISETLIAADDLDQYFEEGTVQLLRAALDGRVSPEELVSWWGRSLRDDIKRTALQFPLRVRDRLGLESLNDSPRIFIGTIHSFKGAEADNVVVFPDLSPSGMREWDQVGAPRDSVVRTFYVGMTRARERLFIGDPAGGLAVHLEEYV